MLSPSPSLFISSPQWSNRIGKERPPYLSCWCVCVSKPYWHRIGFALSYFIFRDLPTGIRYVESARRFFMACHIFCVVTFILSAWRSESHSPHLLHTHTHTSVFCLLHTNTTYLTEWIWILVITSYSCVLVKPFPKYIFQCLLSV